MKEVSISAFSDKPVLIYGPAYVYITAGNGYVYGKKISNRKLYVEPYKALPIETDGTVKINVLYMFKKPEYRSKTGTNIWKKSIEEYLKDPYSTIILGSTDSGKTSFTIFISNLLFEKGFNVGVIDMDPGQGDIGIPGFIGGGLLKDTIFSLEDIKKQIWGFIGSTTPMGSEEILVKETQEIYNKLKKKDGDIILINYHGWIRGWKAYLNLSSVLEKLSIKDIFIFLDQYTESLLRFLSFIKKRGMRIHKLIKPYTRRRNRIIRKIIRERKYKKYLKIENLKEIEVPIDILIKNSVNLKNSIIIRENNILEMLKIDNVIDNPEYIVVCEDKIILYKYMKNDGYGVTQRVFYNYRVLPIPIEICSFSQDYVGLIAGIETEEICLPGILSNLDFKRNIAKIYIPKGLTEFNTIKIGRILISKDGKEIGLLRKYVI